MSKEYLLNITNNDNKIIVNKDNYNHLKDYNFYLDNIIIKC